MTRIREIISINGLVLAVQLGVAPLALASPIPGITTTTDMATTSGYDIGNAVNGSGLSAGPPLPGFHDNASIANAWLSSETSGNILFDLVQDYDVWGFTVWNTNWDIDTPQYKGKYGIDDLVVQYSLNGSGFLNLPGAPTEFSKDNSTNYITPQIFSFDAITADMIRLVISSNHGGPGLGLAEIQFNGNLSGILAVDPLSTVPEPTTLALFGLGLVGLSVAKRKKICADSCVYNIEGAR